MVTKQTADMESGPQPGPETHEPEKVALAFNAYKALSEAIERGLGWGWLHAHKHLDDGQHPTEEQMIRHMHDDVMNEVCEVVDFDKSGVAALSPLQPCAPVEERWVTDEEFAHKIKEVLDGAVKSRVEAQTPGAWDLPVNIGYEDDGDYDVPALGRFTGVFPADSEDA